MCNIRIHKLNKPTERNKKVQVQKEGLTWNRAYKSYLAFKILDSSWGSMFHTYDSWKTYILHLKEKFCGLHFVAGCLC